MRHLFLFATWVYSQFFFVKYAQGEIIWIAGLEKGQNCNRICSRFKEGFCSEKASWPTSHEAMANIARLAGLNCSSFHVKVAKVANALPTFERAEQNTPRKQVKCFYENDFSSLPKSSSSSRCAIKLNGVGLPICPCVVSRPRPAQGPAATRNSKLLQRTTVVAAANTRIKNISAISTATVATSVTAQNSTRASTMNAKFTFSLALLLFLMALGCSVVVVVIGICICGILWMKKYNAEMEIPMDTKTARQWQPNSPPKKLTPNAQPNTIPRVPRPPAKLQRPTASPLPNDPRFYREQRSRKSGPKPKKSNEIVKTGKHVVVQVIGEGSKEAAPTLPGSQTKSNPNKSSSAKLYNLVTRSSSAPGAMISSAKARSFSVKRSSSAPVTIPATRTHYMQPGTRPPPGTPPLPTPNPGEPPLKPGTPNHGTPTTKHPPSPHGAVRTINPTPSYNTITTVEADEYEIRVCGAYGLAYDDQRCGGDTA